MMSCQSSGRRNWGASVVTALLQLVWLVLGITMISACGHTSAVPVSAPARPEGPMVAEYLFDGNYRDSSPYANHGEGSRATFVADRHGKPGGAMHFEQGSSFRVPHSESLALATSISVSAWFREMTDENVFFIVKGTNSPNFSYFVSSTGFQTATNGVWRHTDSARPSMSGWHHIVTTWDGNLSRVYVDGMLAAEGVFGGPLRPNSLDLFIGTYTAVGRPIYFVGDVDEVRIYKKALSEAEVVSLHRG